MAQPLLFGYIGSYLIVEDEGNIKMLADFIAKMMKTDLPDLIGVAANSWVGYQLGTLGCFPSQGLSVRQTCLLPAPISIEIAANLRSTT